MKSNKGLSLESRLTLTLGTLELSTLDIPTASPTSKRALLAKERDVQRGAALIKRKTLFLRCHQVLTD